MSKQGKLKVGVIGLGMGRFHLNNYAQSENAEPVAICDLNEDLLAERQKEFDVPHTFTSVEKMLEMDELEAVSVALPNFLHAPVSIAALKAGKHVLVEKPMAMNAEEGRKMIRAAKSADRLLMMHFNYRFSPAHFWLKKQIESGALGDIHFAKAFYKRRRGIPKLGGWFTQKKQSGGGALIDIGVHILDLTLWMMGYPEVKEMSGASFSKIGPQIARAQNKKFDVDDLSTGFVKFRNGAALFLEASWASNTGTPETYAEWYGDKGGASTQGGLKLFHEIGGEQVDSTLQPTIAVQTPQQHFVDCILKGTQPICPAEHGLTVQKILDAIYDQAKK